MNSDDVKYGVDNLLHRPTRSWLTVLSIMIGIMAIFAIVSFGQGLHEYVNGIAADMGTDKIMIQSKGFAPPGTSNVKLTQSNFNVVKSTVGITEAAPLVIRQAEIKNDKNSKSASAYVSGIPLSGGEAKLAEQTFSLKLDRGRELHNTDKYKAVLGYNYQLADKVFKKPVRLRDTIYINDVPFKVVGFYQSLGNPSDDTNIYIPIDTAKELFNSGDNYEYIIARVEADKSPADVAQKVDRRVMRDRGQKTDTADFYVQTFQDALKTFTNIIDILNGVLLLIVLISVLVSAINIANTMYTSVLERTKEIGVMKAVGAQNSDITIIFLIESGLLGLFGGAVGVIFGYIIASIGGLIAAANGFALLTPVFPWWLILGCLTFAFSIGVAAGVLPAYNASKQKIVDALRYE